MPRNHVLGVCQRLLGILVLVWAQRAEGQDEGLTSWIKANYDVCDCDSFYKLCENTGFSISWETGGPDVCGECPIGSYFRNYGMSNGENILHEHQKFQARDIPQKAPALPLPGLRWQTCQQCPMHTIVNSQYKMNGFIKSSLDTATTIRNVPSYGLMDDGEYIEGARCFSSCPDAYRVMENELLPLEYRRFRSPILYHEQNKMTPGVKDVDSRPFANIGAGDPELQMLHSVVSFVHGDDVSGWWGEGKTADSELYTRYIKLNADQLTSTFYLKRLPAPARHCRPCAVGKSMFYNTGMHECTKLIMDMKTQLGNVLVGPRVGEISWLDIGICRDFTGVDTCVDCPKGTYFYQLDTSNDVMDYTGKTKVWELKQLRCRPCSDGKYTDQSGQINCKICPRNTYTSITDELVVVRNASDYKETWTTPVKLPTACLGCPPGTEYHEYRQNEMCVFGALVPVKFAMYLELPDGTSCCRPCLLNNWRSGTVKGDSCKRLNIVNSATFAPYGQAIQLTCIEGQQKKYCMSRDWSQLSESEPPCTKQGSGQDSDWATCVPCLKTEKPMKSSLGFRECQLCNMQVKETPGEYFEDGKCKSCDDCSVLKTTFHRMKFEWEKNGGYTTLIAKWEDVENTEFRWQDRWYYQTVGVECAPLTRRVMKWDATAKTISTTGSDHYKADASDDQKGDGRLFIEKPVATFHAMMHDNVNNEEKCVYQRCEKFCPLFYQYSSGCGQDPDPWVVKKISVVVVEPLRMSALKTLLVSGGTMTGAVGDYVIVPQGKCALCEQCAPGSYNPECNKWEAGVDPKGTCRTCLSQCVLPGQFLWHASGLRGCAPAGDLFGNGLVQVLTNYECRECPTWIRRNGRMYAVLGCGNKATFGYFKELPSGPDSYDFTRTEVEGLISTHKFSEERRDVDWKFKPFVYPVDYCPDGYYFNAIKPGCKFEPLSYTLENGENIEHGVDPYNRDCCEMCGDCNPGYTMPVKDKWRKCDGSTLSDTQKDQCASKCSPGYYKNTEPGKDSECSPCTLCQNA